ncbi:uncharacterized protein EDB93DRAFT_1107806 [Suillus bovinus]|uniref:uncharacterized protein n=1 Tax=Suillus bovinus TaxID=48563 RepID=UPI001B86930C|nr:uncharacterized protein EDB93DRAFT_1107806 [Suillus bovinus]KAG2132729.1 hypothetical protein EDB93DRAFT_1107806 [Suillus bovinus]
MSESSGSSPVQHSKSGRSPPPSSDPGCCLHHFSQYINQKNSMLTGPGVPPRPHAQCCPALSAVYTPPSTFGLPTIAPIPPPLPDLPLMSVTGTLFQLPEALPLTITPYFAGEADANVRWVKQDQALYKELVGAITDDCYCLANLDPITVSLVDDTLGFSITGMKLWRTSKAFLMWFTLLLRLPLEKYSFVLELGMVKYTIVKYELSTYQFVCPIMSQPLGLFGEGIRHESRIKINQLSVKDHKLVIRKYTIVKTMHKGCNGYSGQVLSRSKQRIRGSEDQRVRGLENQRIRGAEERRSGGAELRPREFLPRPKEDFTRKELV